jgi:hypothetical protein
MKEHYFMLEQLIRSMEKQMYAFSTTLTFSELAFKDKHVFDYWKHFKNVSVGASLDASWDQRAELIRKGTDWKQTVEQSRAHDERSTARGFLC